MTRSDGRTMSKAGAALLAASALALGAPRPAPTPARPAPLATPAVSTVQPTAPLPVLSPAQATQLRALLDADAMAQGLRYAPRDAAPPPLDGEALVRAALAHARAVHAGRLDKADFLHGWGLHPPAYAPLPAFADAVQRDRLAAWIASLPPPYSGYD